MWRIDKRLNAKQPFDFVAFIECHACGMQWTDGWMGVRNLLSCATVRGLNRVGRIILIDKLLLYLPHQLGQGPVLLSPGIHSFPFKLGLPLGLPSTFLGKHGWVQYYCKAVSCFISFHPSSIHPPEV